MNLGKLRLLHTMRMEQKLEKIVWRLRINATLHIASEVKTARPGEIIYLPVTISDAKRNRREQ